MNGTLVKQGSMFGSATPGPCTPTSMERRQAEKCVAEIERLAETGVMVEQVERFIRALAVLRP